MDDSRLPAKMEVSALVRRAEAAGGFGMVLHKGEPDAGTILIVILNNQGLGVLYERMPQPDGARKWTLMKVQSIDNKYEFDEYLSRRHDRDPDVWIVELTVADGERFILNSH